MGKDAKGKGSGKGMFIASWEKVRGEKWSRKGGPKSQPKKIMLPAEYAPKIWFLKTSGDI